MYGFAATKDQRWKRLFPNRLNTSFLIPICLGFYRALPHAREKGIWKKSDLGNGILSESRTLQMSNYWPDVKYILLEWDWPGGFEYTWLLSWSVVPLYSAGYNYLLNNDSWNNNFIKLSSKNFNGVPKPFFFPWYVVFLRSSLTMFCEKTSRERI